MKHDGKINAWINGTKGWLRKIIQRKRLNRINPLKCDGKVKQTVPDFSGKYYGQLIDKISRKSDVKISIKCNCWKKAITEKSSEF